MPNAAIIEKPARLDGQNRATAVYCKSVLYCIVTCDNMVAPCNNDVLLAHDVVMGPAVARVLMLLCCVVDT